MRRVRTQQQEARPLELQEKGRLGLEILISYIAVRWSLSRAGSLPEGVQAIRRRSRSRRVFFDAAGRTSAEGQHLRSAMVRTLTKLPADSRCLMRSLVLLSLLSSRGVETTLVIGVSPKPEFAAHAWIEENGLPLLPTGGSAYSRLIEL